MRVESKKRESLAFSLEILYISILYLNMETI
jgi:hypothetical protein